MSEVDLNPKNQPKTSISKTATKARMLITMINNLMRNECYVQIANRSSLHSIWSHIQSYAIEIVQSVNYVGRSYLKIKRKIISLNGEI